MGESGLDWGTFLEEIYAALADSDFSAHPGLRDRTMAAWEAAARALWDSGQRAVDVDRLMEVSLRQVGCFTDEHDLVCRYRQDFMDRLDEQQLSVTATDAVVHELAHRVRSELTDQGYVVVDQVGIYVFRSV